MKTFVLKIAAGAVRVLAALAGVFARRRDGIALISCQGDKPSQDILNLEIELKKLLREQDRRSAHGRAAGQNVPHGRAIDPGSPHDRAINPGSPHIHVVAGRMRRSVGGAVLFIGRLLSMLRAVAASRVVVIDAFCLAVSIPKKRPGQKVVQIWHAPEAIKKFSQQILDTQAGYKSRTAEILCMHRGYDYILCPADATLPFFSEAFGYPENVFVKYGLPSLDRIGLMKRPAPGEGETPERVTARSAIHARYPVLREGAGGRPLTIVYAPTFRDGDHSAGSTGNSADAAGPTGNSADAVGLVRAFVEALDKTIDSGKEMRDCRGGASPLPEMTKPEINAGAIDEKLPRIALVLKLHPLDPGYPGSGEGDSCIAPSASPAPFALKDKEFPLTDWYAAADVIITDYSGVAVEAAAAGVASYYYVYDIDDYKARRGLNVDLREEAVGKYAFMDAGALARQVLRDFSNGGYDYDALAAFRGKYLETPLSGNARALAAFIAGLA